GACATPKVTAAMINSGESPTTMSRAAVRKYKTPAAALTATAPSHGFKSRSPKIDIVRSRCSQLNDLSGVNVAAGADFLEQCFARRVVQIQNRQRGPAGLISTQRHGGDVDVVRAEQCPNATDHSWP